MWIQHGLYLYEWRAQLLTTRNGHGQSEWYPIGCEGFVLTQM